MIVASTWDLIDGTTWIVFGVLIVVGYVASVVMRARDRKRAEDEDDRMPLA